MIITFLLKTSFCIAEDQSSIVFFCFFQAVVRAIKTWPQPAVPSSPTPSYSQPWRHQTQALERLAGQEGGDGEEGEEEEGEETGRQPSRG